MPVHIGEQSGQHITNGRISRPLVFFGVTDNQSRHEFIGGKRIRLVKHADADPATFRDLPIVRFNAPREQSQQGGFSVTVAPHHTDAITCIDAEREPIKDRAVREFEGQGFPAEEVAHESTAGVSCTKCAPATGPIATNAT